MIDWFKSLALWQKILGIIIPAAVVIALVVIFVPKYNGPGENCVFLNEKANLHSEYYITVTDFTDCDSVSILAHKNDLEKTELIGTDKHFISASILIEHINVGDPKENYILDLDDFKIKDHTGVQIKNFNFFSKENGLALENKDFSTTKAIKDYKWFDTEILPGESRNITLYFEVSKNISTLDTVIVLETDFIKGHNGVKAGTDIVLAQRQQNIDE